LARALSAQGDSVRIAARASHRLSALQAEFPGCVEAVDLCRAEEVETWVDRQSRVDVLVHCAGDFASGAPSALASAHLETLFQSNVLSALHSFGAARSALRANQGAALFFGTAGLAQPRGRRISAGYSAMKSALWVLVRSWALEEAAHGVRVNLLSPGLVPHADAESGTHDVARLARVPLGRAAALSEIVGAAQWLVGPDSSYVTGVNLEVAGGWLA
jgi:NAD(P)-dependent dehydrogenase (short-subunit alcohol dehydrogenase family)